MGFQREFSDILREKLGDGEKKAPKKAPITERNSTFPSWKFEISTHKRTFIPDQIPQVYPGPTLRKQSAPPKPAMPKTADPIFKIGELGLENASALIMLQNLGANLDPARISESELKKEYRKLALRWHPDRCFEDPSGKNFHQACAAYRQLSGAILALSKK